MSEALPNLPRPMARWSRLLGVACLVGVLAGLAAAALEFGLHFGSAHLVGRFTELGQAQVLSFRVELLLLPALGGLASGVVVFLLCRGFQGQGTDLFVRAFHREGGRLPLRGPAVNAAAAIGVISCGGSAGPEGPIAALGASIGSSLSRVLALSPRERRIMLVAGCGAGVGAIFQCPLGGALFAASVLYREPEFEADAIVPACVASVVSYSVYMSFWGYGEHLLAGAETLVFASPRELIPYAVLGVLCGLFSIVYRGCLWFVGRVLVPKLRIPRFLSPLFGGLAVGGIACVLPQVMDGQYVFVQNAMDGKLLGGFEAQSWWWWAGLFGAVALAKCVATGLTLGSGASGGVLGPGVFLGGAVGALAGAAIEAVGPGMFSADTENLRRALIPVGMAGVLSASMRAPLASIVMVTEMTGSYGLIVPLMLVCVSSYVVGRRWGLNDEQVRVAADSPAHAGDVIVHMLEAWRVKDVMHGQWQETVRPETTLRELVELARPGGRPVFVVLDDNRVAGLISLTDIRHIMDQPGVSEAVIASDIMTEEIDTVSPDDDVYHALGVMAAKNHLVLPVVDPVGGTFLGMLSREGIYTSVRVRLDEMRQDLLLEHRALLAIEHEETLHQLMAGVSSRKTDNLQRLFVPIEAVGRSLRESDFRREFGIQVIAIEMPDGSIQCPPDVDRRLETKQRLIAIVSVDR